MAAERAGGGETHGFLKLPAPPRGSQAAGRRLWRSVLGEFELAEHELTLLRQAVRVADVCEVLQRRVDDEGVLLGDRAHPALVELRAERILLARLIVALRVPFGLQEDAGGVEVVTSHGRTQYRGLRGVYGAPGGGVA